jgi:metal-sulfur cluster biosynthetic enzyme
MDNPTPQLYSNASFLDPLSNLSLTDLINPLSSELSPSEIFSYLRHLHDPEHPNLSLEQLRVVRLEHITVNSNVVTVLYTPTIPTCSVATVIGLTLVAKLMFCLPEGSKIRVQVAPKTHDQEGSINKQLVDKERVAAAMENRNLLKMVKRAVKRTDVMPSGLVLA